MMGKILMLFGLLTLYFTAPAFAATSMHQSSLDLCHTERTLARQMWQQDLYSVSPAVSSIMIDAIDGKTVALRKALAGMNAKDAERWRQLAMYLASFEGRADTVDALLDDGAKADGSALNPPLKAAFYHHVVGQLTNDPQISPKAVKWIQTAGLMNNDAHQTGPAIYTAIDCYDSATAKVLLRHGANPMHQLRPHGADPFIAAVVNGDADITKAMLDHGADPCVEDHRLAYNQKEYHLPARTISDIGLKADLPPALIQRLACHAPHSSS
ncbi:MAG: hypothetical protein WBR15_05855 [Gammaproteobacteria bacterium]